jgi:hypothetical protein
LARASRLFKILFKHETKKGSIDTIPRHPRMKGLNLYILAKIIKLGPSKEKKGSIGPWYYCNKNYFILNLKQPKSIMSNNLNL